MKLSWYINSPYEVPEDPECQVQEKYLNFFQNQNQYLNLP
jgi:hypothetical protein